MTDSKGLGMAVEGTAGAALEMSCVSAIFGTVVVYGREAVWGFFKHPF
jgi:hypothetical protein